MGSTSPVARRSTSESSAASGQSSETGTTSPCCRRYCPSGSASATVTRRPVGSCTAEAPAANATGTSAGSPAARRSVRPAVGNSTTSVRPSRETTRPVPRSGLWRWLRRSPGFHIAIRLYHGGRGAAGVRYAPPAAMTSLALTLWILAAAQGAPPAPPAAPMAGDWDLNLKRTHYGPTVQRRRKERFTCKESEGHLECVIRSLRTDGRELVGTFRAALDGAVSPVVGIPGVDEVRLQAGAPGVLGATFGLRGTPVFAYRAYRSDDGRSLVIVAVDPASGKALNSVVVYDRH
jgi:hypothetical protein